ncbi:hypothetical protein BYT27DRAFT_7281682 [Phlegmacium glaucopus]|nr:hypothetical protein BYT27DRAFT_7281682 [Phlegmacium glaucopus]
MPSASTHSISVKPAFPHTDVNTLSTRFKAANFIPTLSTYIHHLVPPPALPVLPNLIDQFDLYTRVTILQPPNTMGGFPKSVDRVRATPSVPAKGRFKAVPAHFDTVLIHAGDSNNNQHTKGTCLEGLRVAQLRAIFSLPEHLQHPHLPIQLAYIEWFTPFRAPHADSGFFPLTRASQNNGLVAEIIPLDRIVSSCHLMPRYGTKYHPAKWDSDTVLEECNSFFLNKYISIQTFFDLEQHLHV